MIAIPSRFALLAALALLLPAAAGALTFIRASDSQLVDRADVIVRAVARPLERAPAAQGRPTTHYSLEVKQALRGATAGRILEIEVPGGRDAEGYVAIVFGAPRLAPGEEALFFLTREEGGQLRVLDFHQGVFRVSSTPGGRVAWRSWAEDDELEIAGRELEAEKPRDLDRFERWVAGRLAGEKRAADYWLSGERVGELAAGGFESAPSSFNIIEHDGLRVRWPRTIGRLNLTFQALDVPQPGLAGGGYAEVVSALAAWNNLPDGLLQLRYGGQTSNSAGFSRRDGINGIIFADVGGTIGSNPAYNCATRTGSLAYAMVWISSETHFYGGAEYHEVIEADTVLAGGLHCWEYFSSLSFEQIVAHEIGHNLALDHTCGDGDSGPCTTSERETAIMRVPFRLPVGGARLSEDDRKAIAFLYGPPTAPGNLEAELDSANRVALSWEDRSENEHGFHIYRERAGQTQQIGSVGAGVRRFDDTGAAPATHYRYLVRAFHEGGASAAAETTVTTAALDTPTQLTANAVGPASIALAWVDKASNETGYEVWGHFVDDNQLGGAELLATLPASSQMTTIQGLIADSTYTFKVRATGVPTGNTAFSNVAQASTLPAAVEPCAEGGVIACLQADRFKIEVRWKDFQGVRGSAAVAPAGSADSGIFYFFSPNNWEMLVKVLDGCAINGHQWVFAAGTTNVETTLIVTDSQTGKTAVYFNPLGTPAPAITDIEAFTGCGDTSSTAARAATPAGAAPLCADGSGELCLLGGRYRARVTWTDFAGQSGPGRPVPAGTADSGLLYFFSPDNWEMLVKVLDGCAINGKVWVFAAATTNVAFVLEVTDTETGALRTYSNPLGRASAAIGDIEAFASCASP